MMWLGTALHLLPQKRVVLRVGEPIPQPKNLEDLITRSIVVTEEMQECGSIMDIFGPVENPYVLVQLSESFTDVESCLGQKFYQIDKKSAKK